MIEFLILGGASALGLIGVTATTADNKRFPRPLYGALVSWWYGGFQADTASLMTANLIDSDYGCEAWKETTHHGYDRDAKDCFLYNESIGVEVYIPRRVGRAVVKVKEKASNWLTQDVTAYEDYYLAKAFKRWKERKQRLDYERKQFSSAHLLEDRINKNYLKIIEDATAKIMSTSPELEGELRAILPPPEPPVETKLTPVEDKKEYMYTDMGMNKVEIKKKTRSKTYVESGRRT